MVKTVIIIAGPTAVGKTELAIEVAKYFHTEIISAYSRQCFKELKIGVARPSEEELAGGATRDQQIGKTGIERQYDQVLSGTSGRQRVEVNAQEEILETSRKELSPAEAGKTVKLSIDGNLRPAATRLSTAPSCRDRFDQC